MIDYSIYYRRAIDVGRISKELPEFDVLLSAFNSSDRVNTVFKEARAKRKIWLVHPEYQYTPLDLPPDEENVCPTSIDEVAQVNALLAAAGDLSGKSLCVDITGFMRHVLAFLTVKLARVGVKNFSVVYSEPKSYKQQEQTSFSTQTSGLVRPVRGMGSSLSSNSADALIIGVGYDDKLISQVATSKDGASVIPIFAFPSLSPDMYQQSAVRAANSGDVALGSTWITKRKFAPANDPFSTAAVVGTAVAELDRSAHFANVYLSPLATKVQVLGFTIFWHLEGAKRGAVSLILPECLTYSRETTTGLRRLWHYELEL
jgi:hypothetical protein